jgi:hypothetical protein
VSASVPGNGRGTGLSNDPDGALGVNPNGNITSPTDLSSSDASTPGTPSKSSPGNNNDSSKSFGAGRRLYMLMAMIVFVEDIDVRHSATGGCHGTYAGKLAKGQIDGEVETFEFSENLQYGTNVNTIFF